MTDLNEIADMARRRDGSEEIYKAAAQRLANPIDEQQRQRSIGTFRRRAADARLLGTQRQELPADRRHRVRS
jgi:hypothetical protein